MKLVEKLAVYRGQYGYSTLLKNKEDKLYVQVGFKRGQEPLQDKVIIDIKDGFLSFYKDKNGLAKPKIVVMDYTEVDVNQNAAVSHIDYVPMPTNDFIPPFDDSDLPF
jgi:hypothetical protein